MQLNTNLKSYLKLCSSNLKEIATFIMKRINPGGVREALWPIYTLADNEEMVSAVLNDLLMWGGLNVEQEFKVYHVHQLLYHLSQFLPKAGKLGSDLLAGDNIASDIYRYSILPKFHIFVISLNIP